MSKVLIIEDNENNLELIKFILEAAGYQIIVAMDGRSGISMALENELDFIILDIQLPDIDGLEVIKQIRADARGVEIPAIAMTSYAMAGDREALLAAGCNGYIEKPIDPDRVVAQIEAVLAGVE